MLEEEILAAWQFDLVRKLLRTHKCDQEVLCSNTADEVKLTLLVQATITISLSVLAK